MVFTAFMGRAVNETEHSVMGDRYLMVSTGAAVEDCEGRAPNPYSAGSVLSFTLQKWMSEWVEWGLQLWIRKASAGMKVKFHRGKAENKSSSIFDSKKFHEENSSLR